MGAVRLLESGIKRAVQEGEREGYEIDEDNYVVMKVNDV